MSLEWQGDYIEVLREGTFEFVRRRRNMGASVILPVTDAGELVLVEQHRAALGRRCVALPAGLIGDEGGEDDPQAAARRELLEETGYAARTWRYVGEFAASPGMSAEMFHFFLATGLERRGAGGGDADEAITVHHVPLGDVFAWIGDRRVDGLAVDAKLVALLPWAKL